jgi:hypothetical protein
MNWEQLQLAFERFPTLENAVFFENIGSTALLLYGFIVGCIVWSGNANGRKIAKQYLLIRLIGNTGIMAVGLLIMGDMPSQFFSGVAEEMVGVFLGQVFYFLICWFYFEKSKRVKNTYGPA